MANNLERSHEDGPLTKTELSELRKRLEKMSEIALLDFYHASHTMCRIERHKVPRARFVQQLVQAWKEMQRRDTGTKMIE